jgi:periplasmic protein TonB
MLEVSGNLKIKFMRQNFLLFILTLLLSSASYSQDTTKKIIEINSDSVVFQKVEYEAEFPGGSSAWTQYLQKNLDADVPIRKKAKIGTYKVIVKFIVTKDGTISNIKAETNYGHGMEEEVIRVIQNGPRWIPAMQNGRKVNAYRRQPISFVVSNS